mmetsp:Transcript_61250/g.169538  ORF Transcript_61250/g.169538 Transcript_61250/m.169538 type:complete len:220 (-) Transcript_61250:61-720(-)
MGQGGACAVPQREPPASAMQSRCAACCRDAAESFMGSASALPSETEAHRPPRGDRQGGAAAAAVDPEPWSAEWAKRYGQLGVSHARRSCADLSSQRGGTVRTPVVVQDARCRAIGMPAGARLLLEAGAATSGGRGRAEADPCDDGSFSQREDSPVALQDGSCDSIRVPRCPLDSGAAVAGRGAGRAERHGAAGALRGACGEEAQAALLPLDAGTRGPEC